MLDVIQSVEFIISYKIVYSYKDDSGNLKLHQKNMKMELVTESSLVHYKAYYFGLFKGIWVEVQEL